MLRLVIILVLFSASLLCVFKAPVYPLWFAAIIAGEFPWIFILAEVALLAWGIRTDRFKTTGNVIAAISLLLYFTPIARAYAVSYNLSRKLTASLSVGGVSPSRDAPFRFSKMITGTGAAEVPFKRSVYSAVSGVMLTLDFYPSLLSGKRPCVIIIHGGSWESGDSRQLPELNSVLARAGYNVASINYRLAPVFKSPAPVDDVAAALTWLKAHSDELTIDAGRFVLLGRSAGGQIALTAAYTLHDPSLKGVIGFYAPADMVWGYAQPTNPLIMDSRKVMEEYLGGTYAEVPEKYTSSSAIDFVTPASVPTLLIHGKNDVLVYYEHSVRLAKKLEANHVRHFLLTWPWGSHGGDYTLNGPSGQLSTYSVLYFLEQVTR